MTDRRVLAVLLLAAVGALAPADARAISGGSAVDPASAPWLATFSGRSVVCGGALIAPDRVLTAAHCVQGADPARLRLRLGGGAAGAGPALGWRGAIFPRGYRLVPSPVAPDSPARAASVDDLAVVLLERPVRGVTPLPLLAGATVPGEAVRVVGRGRTGATPTGAGPDTADPGASGNLRGADQVVLDPEACGAAYGALLRPAKHLCTVDPGPARAQACAGDSGSPVLVTRDGRAAIAGVVAWGGETQGRDCGEGLPDVAERVAAAAGLERALTRGVPAPWASRRVRVRREGRLRRCVIGPWRPSGATFRVTWWREGRAPAPRRGEQPRPPVRTTVRGTGRTIRVARGPVGCTVRADTSGGWAEEDSYNAL